MESAQSQAVDRRTLPRSWYDAPISDFQSTDPDAIVGRIADNCEFTIMPSQHDAWRSQISILQVELAGLVGHVYFEFNIPRMGKRIDVVVLMGSVVVVLEFKVGAVTCGTTVLEQVWDYALDLKNFHEASHNLAIVPIAIPTLASSPFPNRLLPGTDGVYRPIQACPTQFRRLLEEIMYQCSGSRLDPQTWAGSPYHPTPTIIEAAIALYSQHSVDAIARHDAGAQNLSVTSRRIEELIDQAQEHGRKYICFVTGVPGAGKTLVGLNVATRRSDRSRPAHAVYLSGNGPLVAVIQEALTRDEFARRKAERVRARKREIHEKVKSFVQNVHHFRDEAVRHQAAPFDHVAIFDEAQRAWNERKTETFMRTRKKIAGFHQSESEFLISYLNRHHDWAVIVCLVGGGQEIHLGEAGIDSWIEAIQHKFPAWHMFISDRLTDAEYGAGGGIAKVRQRPNTTFDDSLHLSVSMRSFREENLSAFVKAVLDCDRVAAKVLRDEIADRYPIVVTRDVDKAKSWVRELARGTERFGLVASSNAQRLKPHAIDIRFQVNPIHWFLNSKEDTRSSYYLEDAATEFQVQGLELDWACVCWDGDLRYANPGWSFHEFKGHRWQRIINQDNRRYLLNAYRVLLTRARQGMAIFVPDGDSEDPTRSPAFYDSTFQYLTELGIPEVS